MTITITVEKAFKKIIELPKDTQWFECQICYDIINIGHIKIHSKYHQQLEFISNMSVEQINSKVRTS